MMNIEQYLDNIFVTPEDKNQFIEICLSIFRKEKMDKHIIVCEGFGRSTLFRMMEYIFTNRNIDPTIINIGPSRKVYTMLLDEIPFGKVDFVVSRSWPKEWNKNFAYKIHPLVVKSKAPLFIESDKNLTIQNNKCVQTLKFGLLDDKIHYFNVYIESEVYPLDNLSKQLYEKIKRIDNFKKVFDLWSVKNIIINLFYPPELTFYIQQFSL
jgi:hypothetical protein